MAKVKGIPVVGRAPNKRAKIFNVDENGNQHVRIIANAMEYYGATVAQRPEATEVPVGAAYMAVNTGDVWQSNGFEWVVL